MREVKFRGKRVDGKGWIEGFYFRRWERCYMAWGTTNGKANIIEVDPATVGQFTGLHDTHGREICEGDIVLWYSMKLLISWNEHGRFDIGCEPLCKGDAMICKVIGNIHENPELLEVRP